MNATFEYPGTELGALNGADNYYRWILSHFAPYLGKRVIEVGAGIGTFSRFLLNGTKVEELVALEPAKNLFPILQQRLSGDGRVKPVQGYIDELEHSFSADAVVLINVLEHISDDEALLQTVYRTLAPAGTILLSVPALPWLFGSLDKAFDHHRRYTKPWLAEKLQNAGFRLEYLRYFNFPGVITWCLAGKVLKRKTLRKADVQFYDQWVVPWASRLERHWEPPIGQGLLAVGRK